MGGGGAVWNAAAVPIRLALALGLAVCAACVRPIQHRVGTQLGTADAARAAVETRARGLGFTPLDDARRGYDASYTTSRTTTLADGDTRKTYYVVNVRAHDTAAGAVVDVESDQPHDELDLGTLVPDGTTYDTMLGSASHVVWDVSAEVAAGRGPGGTVYRLDMLGHVGYRWFTAEPRPLEPTTLHGVSVVAGGGLVDTSEDRRLARVDVSVALSTQRAVGLWPGRVLSSVPYAVSLGAAYLHGLDGDRGRGVELELTADLVSIGGVFVRGGYEWDRDQTCDGMTYSAGLRLGSNTLAGLGAAVLVAVAVGAGLYYAGEHYHPM